MIDFRIVLERVGKIGVYQIGLFAILSYSGIPAGLNTMAPIFLDYTPNFRCSMGPLDNSTIFPNLTEPMILNVTTPLNSKGEPEDRCVKYGYDLEVCKLQKDLSCVDKSAHTIPCNHGYHFDDSLFTQTIVTECNLVCGKEPVNSLATSLYMVGLLVGSQACGILADRYGRRITMIGNVYALLMSMLALSFVTSVELFITCRFFIAAFMIGSRITVFVHVLETVGTEWRTVFGVAYHVSYIFGYWLWSGIAYLWRDWHQMELAATVASVPIAILSLIPPESARWLFAVGRDERGKEVVAVMAKFNKVHLDETVWSDAEFNDDDLTTKEDPVTYSTIDLFRYPKLRIVSLKVGCAWSVTSIVYYGISLNTASLSGDLIINNLIFGALEIASYVLCAFTMDSIGRRRLLAISMVGSGVALIGSAVATEYDAHSHVAATLVSVFYFIGKAFISASWGVIFNFTGELYPTVVRTNALGFGSAAARIGGFLAPFVIGLQTYVTWVPNAIFGTCGVAGGLLALSIRDTTGVAMMQTMKEAEKFHSGLSVGNSEEYLLNKE